VQLEIDRYYRPIFGFCRYIGIGQSSRFIGLSRCWQNTVTYLTHSDNLLKKAQQSKSTQLFCSNASRCVCIIKQTRWTMELALAFAAKTKASSLIRLIKNHSKILKLLQFDNFNSWILIFEVRYRIHTIFDNEAENKI